MKRIIYIAVAVAIAAVGVVGYPWAAQQINTAWQATVSGVAHAAPAPHIVQAPVPGPPAEAPAPKAKPTVVAAAPAPKQAPKPKPKPKAKPKAKPDGYDGPPTVAEENGPKGRYGYPAGGAMEKWCANSKGDPNWSYQCGPSGGAS